MVCFSRRIWYVLADIICSAAVCWRCCLYGLIFGVLNVYRRLQTSISTPPAQEDASLAYAALSVLSLGPADEFNGTDHTSADRCQRLTWCLRAVPHDRRPYSAWKSAKTPAPATRHCIPISQDSYVDLDISKGPFLHRLDGRAILHSDPRAWHSTFIWSIFWTDRKAQSESKIRSYVLIRSQLVPSPGRSCVRQITPSPLLHPPTSPPDVPRRWRTCAYGTLTHASVIPPLPAHVLVAEHDMFELNTTTAGAKR